MSRRRQHRTIDTPRLCIAIARAGREPLPWAVRSLLWHTRREATGRTGAVVVPARNRPVQDAVVLVRYADLAALLQLEPDARDAIAREVNAQMARPPGFAGASADERRQRAARAGRIAQRRGRAHQWTREQAAAAGRKSAAARRREDEHGE